MRLTAATEGDVVQNTGNSSFYRYSRPEKNRARIRPLELFPNGQLIPKPTDTLVDADLQVALVGRWHDGMVVDGNPTHSRRHYEEELAAKTELLVFLESEYEKLPVNGTGKLSRGSWANKLKNCRMRIETLQDGLAAPDGTVRIETVAHEPPKPDLAVMDVALLPSGQPGLILEFSQVGAVQYATVRARHRPSAQLLTAPIPADVLRPWEQSRLCTI